MTDTPIALLGRHGMTACIVAGALACGRSADRAPAINATRYQGAAMQPPLDKPSFTLARAPGDAPFDFRRETDGYVTLLYFGYTNCPDICPVHLANIAAVLRDAPYEVRSRVKVVFVTIDPARDTPAVLGSWLAGFDSSFIGLRGPDSTVALVERAVHLTPAVVTPHGAGMGSTPDAYGVGHAAQVLAFTADGRGPVVYPFGTRQQQWAHDLPLLVADSGRGPTPPAPRTR